MAPPASHASASASLPGLVQLQLQLPSFSSLLPATAVPLLPAMVSSMAGPRTARRCPRGHPFPPSRVRRERFLARRRDLRRVRAPSAAQPLAVRSSCIRRHPRETAGRLRGQSYPPARVRRAHRLARRRALWQLRAPRAGAVQPQVPVVLPRSCPCPRATPRRSRGQPYPPQGVRRAHIKARRDALLRPRVPTPVPAAQPSAPAVQPRGRSQPREPSSRSRGWPYPPPHVRRAIKLTRQREAEAQRDARAAERRLVTPPALVSLGSTPPPLRAKRPLDHDAEDSPDKRVKLSESETEVVVEGVDTAGKEGEEVDPPQAVDVGFDVQDGLLDEYFVIHEAGPLDVGHDYVLEEEDIVLAEQVEVEESAVGSGSDDPQPAVVLDEVLDGPLEGEEENPEWILDYVEDNMMALGAISLSAITFWVVTTGIKTAWSLFGLWSGRA